MDHVEKEHPGFDRNSVVAAAGELVFRHTQELTTRSKVRYCFANIEYTFWGDC